MVHAKNEKYVTDMRDTTEEVILHGIMTSPVMSGF
jgi:hypothetical protein